MTGEPEIVSITRGRGAWHDGAAAAEVLLPDESFILIRVVSEPPASDGTVENEAVLTVNGLEPRYVPLLLRAVADNLPIPPEGDACPS